jgi:hypothetical protein
MTFIEFFFTKGEDGASKKKSGLKGFDFNLASWRKLTRTHQT